LSEASNLEGELKTREALWYFPRLIILLGLCPGQHNRYTTHSRHVMQLFAMNPPFPLAQINKLVYFS
jgi:hypothetical protein